MSLYFGFKNKKITVFVCSSIIYIIKRINVYKLFLKQKKKQKKICIFAVQLPRENETTVNNTSGGGGSASNEKKTRGRGFIRSLLCCLGRSRGGSSKSSKASSVENDQYAPTRTGSPRYLLPPIRHQDIHKKCMVIDLDETLVHSSFKPINNADFVVPVEIDGNVHQVYVLKRPYVDEFLQRMGELYECVLFTASLAKVSPKLIFPFIVVLCKLYRNFTKEKVLKLYCIFAHSLSLFFFFI